MMLLCWKTYHRAIEQKYLCRFACSSLPLFLSLCCLSLSLSLSASWLFFQSGRVLSLVFSALTLIYFLSKQINGDILAKVSFFQNCNHGLLSSLAQRLR